MANISNINNILRTDSLGVGINRDPLGVLEVSSATRSGIKMFNTGSSGRTYETYVDASGNYIIYDVDADRNDLVINNSGNSTFAGGITATYGNYSSGINADYFRTLSSNSNYNLFTRNNTGNTIFVQAAQSNASQPIAKFSYGSATVNAGTAVLQVSKDNSHFVNCNVGIGTVSPDYTLDVEKDVDTWIARIYNTGNDANAQGLLIRSDANSSHDALVMGVYADGGYKMILRSTGLLGIGVSPFINNLTNGVGIDLKNNAGLIGYANAMYISSNAYYNSGWKYKAAGTANLLQVGSTTGTVSLRQAISGSINQAISFDQTITILNNGNVGIGYTNPASNKLEVNGRAYIGPVGTGFGTTKPTMQSNAVLRLKPHDTNSTNMNFASVNGGAGIGIQTTNGPGTANWDIALSPFGGNVGIGMVQPAAKLDVVGNIATGTRDGGVGYKNQLFQCSKTATGSGVGIDVMFVGHTHALNITVMCVIDGAQAAVGRGYALSSYGYATATLTQTRVSGNMVGVSMIYVNSGGSESYVLRVTPTYAGSSNPTIYLSAQGQSNILLRTAV